MYIRINTCASAPNVISQIIFSFHFIHNKCKILSFYSISFSFFAYFHSHKEKIHLNLRFFLSFLNQYNKAILLRSHFIRLFLMFYSQFFFIFKFSLLSFEVNGRRGRLLHDAFIKDKRGVNWFRIKLRWFLDRNKKSELIWMSICTVWMIYVTMSVWKI